MTALRDDTILKQIHGPVPSVAALVTRFRCGWRQGCRVREALLERELEQVPEPEAKKKYEQPELWL
jgi:hypothetical protein